MVKKWKCTVCGYIHVGDDPPETCPVCGADRSKFVLVMVEKTGLLQDMVTTFKLHPIAAHFTNGLLPVAVLFLLLTIAVDNPCLETTIIWLVIIVTLVAPVSLASGIYDWQTSFGGSRAPIFFKKIGLALLLLTLGVTSVYLRYEHPDLLEQSSLYSIIFVVCLFGMLACVTLLGHYGGILVFQAGSEKSLPDIPGPESARDDWAARIVSLAPDAILAADAEGIIRLWNHGAERIFGIANRAAIGQSLDLIIPEKLRQRHWQGWAGVIRSGTSQYGETLLQVPALRSDGRRISVEFSIVMLKESSGQVNGIAAILRDVTERWAREKVDESGSIT